MTNPISAIRANSASPATPNSQPIRRWSRPTAGSISLAAGWIVGRAASSRSTTLIARPPSWSHLEFANHPVVVKPAELQAAEDVGAGVVQPDLHLVVVAGHHLHVAD